MITLARTVCTRQRAVGTKVSGNTPGVYCGDLGVLGVGEVAPEVVAGCFSVSKQGEVILQGGAQVRVIVSLRGWESLWVFACVVVVHHVAVCAIDEDVTSTTGADEGALCVATLLLTSTILPSTLIHICTGEGVSTESVALGASTSIASSSVDTLLLTPVSLRLTLILILTAAAIRLQQVTRMTAADSASRPMTTHVLTPTIVLQAGIDYFHVDHVTGLMIGTQLVASFAEALVRAPGVTAELAAGARCVALVSINARDFIICQGKASPAGAPRLTHLHQAAVLAAAIIHRARVHHLTPASIGMQAEPRSAGADKSARGVVAVVVAATVVNVASLLTYAGTSVRKEAVTLTTATLVGTYGVDALVGTSTIVLLTFVHILAGAIVRSEPVTWTTATQVRTHSVLTRLVTTAIVRATLIPIILTMGAVETSGTDAAVVETAAKIVATDAATHSCNYTHEQHCPHHAHNCTTPALYLHHTCPLLNHA